MKKSLIVFVAAFALSAGFAFLSLVTQVAISNSGLFNSTDAFQSIFTLSSIIVDLGGLALFFAVFYFIAKKIKIQVVKSTTVALLLGVFLGSAIPYVLSIVAYHTYLAVYLSLVAGSLLSSIFRYFFPALTAMLFAELREKKSG
ncbi:MAG TPA: hypothetical protein VF350_04730 [Candidatus Bathyarchaeia archaeon]